MRVILGFPGYLASEEGRIYSTRSGADRSVQSRSDRYGYEIVTIKVNGRRERHSVHKLVLLAFSGGRGVGLQCRHLNGDRKDNRPCNLRWGTAVENAADAIRHGTLGRGMRARHRRLTSAHVSEMRARLRAGESSAVVARAYGVSEDYPRKVALGLRWSS